MKNVIEKLKRLFSRIHKGELWKGVPINEEEDEKFKKLIESRG